MQIGMIGLGRMGGNMVRRLMKGGHSCVVYDRGADVVAAFAKEGATGAKSVEDLASKLQKPRAVWIMVPSGGPTESTVQSLAAVLFPSRPGVGGMLPLPGARVRRTGSTCATASLVPPTIRQ